MWLAKKVKYKVFKKMNVNGLKSFHLNQNELTFANSLVKLFMKFSIISEFIDLSDGNKLETSLANGE